MTISLYILASYMLIDNKFRVLRNICNRSINVLGFLSVFSFWLNLFQFLAAINTLIDRWCSKERKTAVQYFS